MRLEELTVLQHIAQNKDLPFLEQFNVDYLVDKIARHIFGKWSLDKTMLEEITFRRYVSTSGVQVTDELIRSIWRNPISHSLQACAKNLHDDYVTGRMYKILDESMEKLKKGDPYAVKEDITSHFHNIPTLETEGEKKLTDDIDEDNQLLVKVATFKRPATRHLITMKKTMIVYGGYSGHHKTNITLDFLDNALEANKDNPNFKVAFFSKEMDYEEIRDRLFAKKLGLNIKRVLTREIRIKEYVQKFQDQYPLWDTNFKIISPDSFTKIHHVGELLYKHKPDVWALDYLQLAALGGSGNAERQNASVMEWIAACKVFVRTMPNLGVVVSQLRKRGENRVIWFPRLDDLEWSGLTQQLAHSIGLCFWPYKVNEECRADWYCIAYQKNRNSAIFKEVLQVFPDTCDFRSEPAFLRKGAYSEYFDM